MEQVFVAVDLPEPAQAQLEALGVPVDYWKPSHPGATITTPELIEYASNATILISAVNVAVPAEYLRSAPHLRLVANIGDGYDNIDIAVAKSQGIAVTNAPTRDSVASTAELTVALTLAVSRKIIPGDEMMRKNAFSGWQVTGYVGGHQVFGKKIIIIGLGRVGKLVAQILSGFETEISYVDPVAAPADFATRYRLARVTLEEGLSQADYLTLNCSLNDQTRSLIDAQALSLMKPEAYLINCARGGIVDEDALLEALNRHQIAGAAIDTPQHEPRINPALAALPNVVATPHAGNATFEARVEMSLDASKNVALFLAGKPLLYQV